MRVLTLYMCRDRGHFKAGNFASVVEQEGVEQEVFVVSAEPLGVEGLRNVVVPVKRSWPLPIRVSYSVNAALRILRLKHGVELRSFDYLFKVDSDVVLPRDYLARLTSTRAPVAGVGAALLISVPFFLAALGGAYPVKYCDDGYVGAKSVAMGAWPPSHEGLRLPPVGYDKPREFAYGVEYYRWGLSPVLLALMLFASRVLRLRPHERRRFKAHIVNVAGYLWAALHRLDKYELHADYRRMRNRHLAEKFLKIFFLNRI
jgi:transposase